MGSGRGKGGVRREWNGLEWDGKGRCGGEEARGGVRKGRDEGEEEGELRGEEKRA